VATVTGMTGDGERFEVDARFLLANERTLLAWQRTAFALVAGGVAAPQLGDDVAARGLLAALLLLSGQCVPPPPALNWKPMVPTLLGSKAGFEPGSRLSVLNLI